MRGHEPPTTDVMTRAVALNPNLIVERVRMRGRWFVQIEQADDHKFYRIGESEYGLISMLDGRRTLASACGAAAQRLGSGAPTTSEAVAIVRWLMENRLARFADDPAPSSSSPSSSGDAATWWKRLNPFWIKLPILGESKLLRDLASRFAFCFTTGAAVVWLAAVCVAAVCVMVNWNRLTDVSVDVWDSSQWIVFLAIWMGLKFLHECGHAVACTRFGGTVRGAGLVFVLFAPLAYVDVTDAWRIRSRQQRMMVSLAGMAVEWFVAAAAVIVWSFTESPMLSVFLQQLILTATVTTFLFNANPLMRFDGYHVVADAVDVPNLDALARKILGGTCVRWLTGRVATGVMLDGWRWWFALVFGFAAWVWRWIIAIGLLVAATWLAEGAGIAIAVMGGLMWYALPLWKAVRWASRSRRERPAELVRALFVGGGTIVAFVIVFTRVPVPTLLTAPAIVQFPPDSAVRARVDGFLVDVAALDGGRVREGELLARIDNDELRFQLADLELQIEIAEQKVRAAINDHDAAAERVETANVESLREQFGHLRSQSEGTLIVAHRDGVLVAPRIQQSLGTMVQRGDVLMRIVEPNRKEAIVLVDQRDMDAVRESIDEVSFAVAGQHDFSGTVTRSEPRATDELPRESMAATSGGPLAVRASDDSANGDFERRDRWQMLEPRFRVVVSLDESIASQIPDGTIVQARFGHRRDTIARRIDDAVRALWYAAESAAMR